MGRRLWCEIFCSYKSFLFPFPPSLLDKLPTLELQMTFFGLSTFTPFSPRSHNVTNTYILGGATKKSITCNNGWQR